MRYPRFLSSVVVAAVAFCLPGVQPAVAGAWEPGLHSIQKTTPTQDAVPAEQGIPAPEPLPGEDRYVVMFDGGTDPADKAADLRAKGWRVGQTMSHAVKAAVVTATPDKAAELSRTEGVASVSRDKRISATATPPSTPWNLDRIDQRSLPLSGTYTPAGTGVNVKAYVVDTGVHGATLDFGGRVTAGWSAFANLPGNDDCSGHGTHVAGILGGAQYGVAKSVTIVPVRVLGCDGGGWTSDVIAGLDWVVAQHQPGTPAVANLSMSASGDDPVDAAVQGAINDGVTVVAAAGNSATDACTVSPARVAGVLTVAASDQFDGQAAFSNSGPCVDLYAPGVQVESDWYNPNTPSNTATAVLNGTSMASPHVAGTAALLLSPNPALTPTQLASRLLSSATVGVITNAGNCTPNRLVFAGASLLAAKDPAAGTFTSLAPCRQLDTRNGTGGISGPVGPGQTISVKVTGRGGIPSTNVSAVAVNVTVTSPTATGNITVHPGGTQPPGTSNLNFVPNQTVPNYAITAVGTDGTISFTNNSPGTVQLIADSFGFFVDGTPTTAGAFADLTPFRQMDSRNGTGGVFGPIGPWQTISVKVTGRGGIPDPNVTAVSAVAVNVTVTSPTATGNIAVLPGGTPPPGTSNLNFVPNQTVPNYAITAVGTDGTISFTNNSPGTVQLIADSFGFFVDGTPTAAGAFTDLTPYRQMDTRYGTGGISGPVGPWQTISVKVTGRGGIPDPNVTAVSAVALNVTVTSPTATGNITVHPGGTQPPGTSNLNFVPNQTVPNYAITAVGTDGTISFTNNSPGTVQLIADSFGYFLNG